MKRLAISVVLLVGSLSLVVGQAQTQTQTSAQSSKQSTGSSQASSSASSSAHASAGGSASSGGSSGSSSGQSSHSSQFAEQHAYQLVLDGMQDGQTVHNESSSIVKMAKNSVAEQAGESKKSTVASSRMDAEAALRSAMAAGAYRLFRTRMMPVVNAGFGPGEGWETSLKPMFGRPEATVRFMVVGDEKVGQLKALKVTFEYEEPAAKDATTATGTLWIDTKNGWPIRAEMDIKNLRSQSGLLDATVVEVRTS